MPIMAQVESGHYQQFDYNTKERYYSFVEQIADSDQIRPGPLSALLRVDTAIGAFIGAPNWSA